MYCILSCASTKFNFVSYFKWVNFRNLYRRKPLEITYIRIPVNIIFKNCQVSKDEVFVATTYTAREYTDQFGQLNFIITMRSLKVKVVAIFFWPMLIHLLIFLQFTYIFFVFLQIFGVVVKYFVITSQALRAVRFLKSPCFLLYSFTSIIFIICFRRRSIRREIPAAAGRDTDPTLLDLHQPT